MARTKYKILSPGLTLINGDGALGNRSENMLRQYKLRESLKRFLYYKAKWIHRWVPVAIREKYRERYRRLFLNKVAPAYISSSDKDQTSTDEVFLNFKQRLRDGLSIHFDGFDTYSVPNQVSIVLPVYNQSHYLA